jgi:hypothetical protein
MPGKRTGDRSKIPAVPALILSDLRNHATFLPRLVFSPGKIDHSKGHWDDKSDTFISFQHDTKPDYPDP